MPISSDPRATMPGREVLAPAAGQTQSSPTTESNEFLRSLSAIAPHDYLAHFEWTPNKWHVWQ